MNKQYIMLKDQSVLETDNYHCRILNYELIPVSLRYPEVNYDDVIHGWTENRTMNIGKTNAKKLLASFRIRQSNEAERERIRQIADYILGNEDRHGANFGFFMDNSTGELLHLYPLMNHDHAFSEENDIPSQTSEEEETVQKAAFQAIPFVTIDYHHFMTMEKPSEIDQIAWKKVLDRCLELMQKRHEGLSF